MGAFDGLAAVYEKSRHGYPAELRDHLVEIGALSIDGTVVDIGAGTGQLARLAAVVSGNVVAIDPEPDMVEVGRQLTADQPAIRWLLGADSDVPELLKPPIDLVLIGNAFHHMDQPGLLRALGSLVAPAGFVVVCSTSIPVWLQNADWSRAVRHQLSEELGRPIGQGGTPDHDADQVWLAESPFSHVEPWALNRDHQRSAESIVGEIVSSTSGALGDDATRRIFVALEPHLTAGAVTEHVTTTAIIARRP